MRAGQSIPEPAALDAVTLDAHGTLVALRDPTDSLVALLRERGADRASNDVRAAFHSEAAYYAPRSAEGRDEPSLAKLRSECAGVFLEALDADLDPGAFAPLYVGTFVFEVLDGAVEALTMLRARGLAVAVVTNWDISVHDRLRELALTPLVDAVVSSADVGIAKPDPDLFRQALHRLGVGVARALHVGDSPSDEQGAAAAGIHFVPAPLSSAFAPWR